MNKLFKYIGLTAVLIVFSAVLGLSAVNAAGAPPILHVTQTKKQININEKVSIDALSVVSDQLGTTPESISIYVNNEKNPTTVCKDKHYCGMTFWVFEKSKGNKWYKFTVKSVYKGATATKTVYVFITNNVVGSIPKAEEPVNPKTPIPEQVPLYSEIITSNHQPKVGEAFSATIYPTEKEAVLLTKIDVLLDGKVVKTCALNGSIAPCGTTFGPFTANDVGEHKYEFLIVAVNGKTIQPWGKFWVNPAAQAVDDYPEYEKVVTSGGTITVGEIFKAEIFAKAGKPFYRVDGYVDEVKKTSDFINNTNCMQAGCNTMGMVFGPITVSQIGEHTYKFIVTSKSGKSITMSGKFIVVAVPEKDAKAPEVSITSDKDVLKLNESANLTVTATDNKAISKIQILVFGGVVKECLGVDTCTYQIGPVTKNTYVTKYTYSAYAYDAAGNNAFTGNKYITVDMSQPVTMVEPIVSVEVSKEKISTADTVSFKGSVNPGSKKLTKMQIMVNMVLVKECTTSVCEYVGGPYPTYVGGVVHYASAAFFSDGSYKTTGYYLLPVTDMPKIVIGYYPAFPDYKTQVDLLATAQAGNKTIKMIQIVVNDSIVKTCETGYQCLYKGGPYNTPADNGARGYKPITYAANVCFTDNSCITTWNKTLAISAGVSPN